MYSILIIDDEPIVKIALRSILPWEEHGFSICGTASNGLEAMSLIEKHQPDVIITDLKMPEMDGLEATRTIRNLNREDCKKIPIYAMSANAFDEDVKRSLASGMNGHRSKPVNLQVLEKTLQKVLG